MIWEEEWGKKYIKNMTLASTIFATNDVNDLGVRMEKKIYKEHDVRSQVSHRHMSTG